MRTWLYSLGKYDHAFLFIKEVMVITLSARIAED